MKKSIYTLILFQFLSFVAFSQEIVMTGLLIDSETNNPVEFANIGVVNKNKGTVSDLDGNFRIKFSKEFAHDSLTISHVIYKTVKIPIRNSKDLVISLQPNENKLAEVNVTNRKKKNRKIGVKSYNPLLWASTASKEMDIIESAKQIKIPNNKTVRVKDVNFYLRRGFEADSAFIRINFYESLDDRPGDKIIFENIIQRKLIEQGWINIDLTKYSVYLEEDCFVGVEIIPNTIKPLEIFMGGILTKGNAFMRNSSLGKWTNQKAAPSINVEVEY